MARNTEAQEEDLQKIWEAVCGFWDAMPMKKDFLWEESRFKSAMFRAALDSAGLTLPRELGRT